MSMKFDEKIIGAMADELDMGMQCFYHIPTGAFESHPDTSHSGFEPEWWQEVMDKIEADRSNYFELERMGSREDYKIMEDFAYAQRDEDFKDKLLNLLQEPKPFRNFRYEVDNSDYR